LRIGAWIDDCPNPAGGWRRALLFATERATNVEGQQWLLCPIFNFFRSSAGDRHHAALFEQPAKALHLLAIAHN
jgi:hypothetical protein